MQTADIDLGSNSYQFRPIRWYKSIKDYKLCGSKPSYTCCGKMFKQCLEGIGCDSTLYGLHSLRGERATAADANNPNLSKRMLKLHGQWKSSIFKRTLIND